MKQVTNTTDGKFIGMHFDESQVPIILGDFKFTPEKTEDVGDGIVRYSNSNYILDARDSDYGKNYSEIKFSRRNESNN